MSRDFLAVSLAEKKLSTLIEFENGLAESTPFGVIKF